MTATKQQTQSALWNPGWYELDQTLVAGETSRFWFFQTPPSDFPQVENFDFVFYNQMASASNIQVREARVVSITHPQIGELKRIDTDGLDYIFYPVEGREIIVNAEEDPGTVYDAPLIITEWSVQVHLGGVSEPISDT